MHLQLRHVHLLDERRSCACQPGAHRRGGLRQCTRVWAWWVRAVAALRVRSSERRMHCRVEASCVAWVCASNSCKYVLLNREAIARASMVVSSPVCGYSAPSRVRCGRITQHIDGHMTGSIRPSFTSHSRANSSVAVLFLPAWVVCPTSHHCRVCVVQRGCVLHWAAQPLRFPVATPLVKIDLG